MKEPRTTVKLIRDDEAKAHEFFEEWNSNPNLENVTLRGSGDSFATSSMPNEWWLEADIVDHLGVLHEKYTVNPVDIRSEPKQWGKFRMEILMNGEKIGEYNRNYSPLSTFHPFLHHGKEYALYSTNYTATRVMTLPDCKDLCGEESSGHGFCPVEFLVPYDPWNGCHGDFGFVAGCIWGDDTSWKVELLDLSRIEEGIFQRSARFGYIELPEEMTLAQSVRVDWEMWAKPYIKIVREQTFHLDTGKDAHW